MKHKIFTLLTIGTVALSSNSYAGEKEEVAEAFSSWRSALSSGKAENITKLYSKDAILLATLAAKPLKTDEERVKYFTTLSALPKLAATVNEEYVQILDEDDALVSGIYTFSFEEKGKKVEIPARFSFIYKKDNGKWMIFGHHSSKVPEVM